MGRTSTDFLNLDAKDFEAHITKLWPTKWPNISAAPFLLTGFPGLEIAYHWISIPFFAVYFSVLLGNGTLLYLIKDDHSLHEAMYYFLAMLAGTDLMVTLTTMPTVMGTLWLNHREISQRVCFLQAYFIHSLSIVESGVLLAMAYDRFIAICTPLRYNSILTNSRVMKVGLGVLMRGFSSLLPPIMPLYFFPYCHSHVLSHAFCLHQDVMELACADITFNRLYPVVLVALTFFLDVMIIVFSYVLILKTVMSIAFREELAKALNTCVSHICRVLVFYITVIGLTFIHRFGKHAPCMVHLTMSYFYFLFPPLMNPIIYSIKTKQIQRSIIRLFSVQNRA
ncbi:olfactory receptor 51B2-like [Trichechus manatus latirostris]|uniref:Olfactory receptor n=1 Tax=Trichechus manatus latirostris TaxID=127582 RepID=A0A2Y9G3K0_TRIMA|nr:olfactory receptor 51B2-like [Trichechus manatus latirostris]